MKNLNKPIPGVTFSNDGAAQVAVWAPDARSVAVVLQDGGNIALHRVERGYWTTTTDSIKPGTLYKFELNNGKGLPDPASKSQPQGVHEWSEAINLKQLNARPSTANVALANYIIYELHTGTFTPEGTFKAVIDKLPYLKELGITAIEIMPAAQFPGERNWGYDGVFPFAVQNSYGGAQGLIKLVNACHEAGLAIVLDVVYNHVGPEGNYLNEYGPYFTSKYNTPWGNAINFDDAGCDEVRHFFVQNALMWFRDFGIDALRLDAVHAIKDFSPKHLLQEIGEAVDELSAETGRKHYLIVECDLNDKRFIDATEKNGYGMDAQWIDEFHHALRVTAGGERNGYYADFEGINYLAKSYKDAYVYDGIYSEERQKTFGTKTGNAGSQFVVFSQNHDHVGNRMLGERSSILFSTNMQRLMAAAVVVSPYLPLLFMGEEYGEKNPFMYFVSHSDKELIEAVRKGRRDEFKAFHAEGEAPDPQAAETFERSKLNWSSQAQQPQQEMLAYYKQLITLRKSLPALNNCNRNQLEVSFNGEDKTLQLHRWEGNEHVYCFMNFSKEPRQYKEPSQDLRIVFNSSVSVSASSQTVQPESIIILSNSYV